MIGRAEDGFMADRYPTCPHFFHTPTGIKGYRLCANCGVRESDLPTLEKLSSWLKEYWRNRSLKC